MDEDRPAAGPLTTLGLRFENQHGQAGGAKRQRARESHRASTDDQHRVRAHALSFTSIMTTVKQTVACLGDAHAFDVVPERVG